MKLKQIAHITSGLNSIELKNKKEFNNLTTYTNDDIEFDLYQGYQGPQKPASNKAITSAGSLIINTMTNQATIISPQSDGKIMPQHIMRLGLDPQEVDPWYLCYVLNESESVKRQLYSTMEGTVLRRVTASSIKNLDLDLPAINVQKKIGNLYRILLVQNRLQREYNQKYNQAILTLLKQSN
ncbi:hypothetical protein [Bombilactobacillus bombi]|uniref:hypothetical protein n=1 Tax=Bombilactobacillus bombi TaxID=1303590 RepID=UPI0015E5B037|nr:hypothetical protein [Bombilactobacillus bombi]MBA1433865.1 hypothetical protein [Bombilactobacillus bombi]